MTTNRRSFLYGALAGVSASGAATVASRYLQRDAEKPAAGPVPVSLDEKLGIVSFAQQGEDIALEGILGTLGITKPNYIDIGAGHPITGNNTYRFYRNGFRGVLVEPNPHLAKLLREVRPGDTVVEAGIGIDDQSEADFYVIRRYGQLNTFSKGEADRLVERYGPGTIEKVIKRRLLNINGVLDEHFAKGGPHLFSIDIQGLDEAVLRTLDFDRHRPATFCVETMDPRTGGLEQGILTLMEAKGYQVRGGSFVNSIFVDKARMQPRKGAPRPNDAAR